MTNWKSIHPSFTEELQSQWEKNNFTYSQIQPKIQVLMLMDGLVLLVISVLAIGYWLGKKQKP